VAGEHPLLDYDQLIGALGRLCAERRSGTMFVITPDNQTARFELSQGEIVSVGFRVKRGREALPLIKTIAAGRFDFSTDMPGPADATLPATHELLAQLGLPAALASAPQPVEAVPPAIRPQVERTQRVLEAELTEFLGPMARMVCREHLARAGPLTDPNELARVIDALAREIGDPAKEARFRRETLAKLRE
jgi:hypothetical protein